MRLPYSPSAQLAQAKVQQKTCRPTERVAGFL